MKHEVLARDPKIVEKHQVCPIKILALVVIPCVLQFEFIAYVHKAHHLPNAVIIQVTHYRTNLMKTEVKSARTGV